MNRAMSRAHRIVGVDGTATGSTALRWAARRSAEDGTPLLLAHVGPPTGQPDASVLEDARATIDAEHLGLAFESRHLRGPVWKAISEIAEPDDVIVIGADTAGLGRSRVSGALSVQLAITAQCAVAVIPDVDLIFRRGVITGIGAASTAPRVAKAAYVEARDRDAPVTLIHGGCSDHCTDGLDAAERALLTIDPTISIRRRILSTPAADALLDAALDKELLVLGRGSRSASGSPIGAVTHTVLLNATAPVLLLPAG
jgi:nucleotide-binding universal stress UspA family protein